MDRKPTVTLEPCIYCGSTLPRVGREHVIPQAFGAFEQNFTLQCVCDECNTYFGKHLELALARDSAEAFLRLRHGVKPPAAARDLRNRRIAMTIEEPGPYKGAKAVLLPDKTGTGMEPVTLPQVGFRRAEDKEFCWIREGDLSEATVALYRGSGVAIRIVGHEDDPATDQAVKDRLIAHVRELGISFQLKGEFSEPVTNEMNMVAVGTVFTVDQIILRAVAKIAFNYAARTLGGDMLRLADFDEIRQFVRFGIRPRLAPIRVHQQPILGDDPNEGERQTNGHICCVGWAGRSTSIVASVSLFNELTYDVLLCPRFTGAWLDLGSGHLFDHQTRKITRLQRRRVLRPLRGR